MKVRILTPRGIFQNEEAEELILTTRTGQIGILKGHAPLITALDIGPIVVRNQSNRKGIALIGGFALVQDDKVTILVNEAVESANVEKVEAEKTLRDAKNRLDQAQSEKEKVETELSFKRARARFQITSVKLL